MLYYVPFFFSIFVPRSEMNVQLWHDAALAVNKAGTDSKYLTLSYYLWTGSFKNADEILAAYNEIREMAHLNGYSYPLDYLKDFFSGQYDTEIAQFDEPLDDTVLADLIRRKKEQEENEQKTENDEDKPKEEQPVTANLSIHSSTDAEHSVGQESNESIFIPSKITRPDKLAIEPFEGTPLHIPPHIRCKITKYKRVTNCYRQMDQRHKDADNRFDYFLSKAITSTSGRFSYDNTEKLANYPFIGTTLDEDDIRFRKIMTRVSTPGNHPSTDRLLWQEDIVFIKKYYESKCGELPVKEFSTKRLATSVAFLMKQMQVMFFESADESAKDQIFYFKSKLIFFYNFYKK